MDPELPKTLTFAADAAKKAHDLIAVLEEEFAKLKEALRSASELMGYAHAAVIAQPPGVIPDAPPVGVKPNPAFTVPTHPAHAVENPAFNHEGNLEEQKPEPPIHHS
jgi:hypothetical protein